MAEPTYAYYDGKVVEVSVLGYFNNCQGKNFASCVLIGEDTSKDTYVVIHNDHLRATKELAHELACKLAKERVQELENDIANKKTLLKTAMQDLDNLLKEKKVSK
jgi:hypothetical protein